MTLDAATLAQNDAADPDRSTWLAANAGSGKTRVLTDRVARLLLRGVLPERILCLTFTKAAASEMQNRLFARLGAWAMLDDGELGTALSGLGVTPAPDAASLREARTLFARAIEAPGGLKIQTIHAFCAALLRRFPLEAQVSPQFRELDERAALRLRAEVLERMASGPQASLVAAIAPAMSGEADAFLAQILRASNDFAKPPSDEEIAAAYGLRPGLTEAALLADLLDPETVGFLRGLVPALQKGGKTDDAAAGVFAGISGPTTAAVEALESLFLYKSGPNAGLAKTGKLPTKGAQKDPALAAAAPILDDLAERVAEARDARLSLIAAQRDRTLYAFARAFLDAYGAEKAHRGLLDFDDLILRTRDLLGAPGVAEWVLWRLDGGIDHILVDEAQDTSPAQWQVIERLAQEITAGLGARTDRPRTLFVVGDKKQSIYAFQGADATGFDRMRAAFAERLAETEAPLRSRALAYSFRSAAPILRVVDATFAGRAASGFADDEPHKAFRSRLPGRVDLWPVIAPAEDPEDGPWYEPVDRVGAEHHTVLLARRIARFIRDAIDTGQPIPSEQNGKITARPARAGDFLILVRGRQRLFHEIIRAAKQADLPIAGADQLRVMAELAVRDIVALLQFLATPEDDLALATALRSPILGLSEAELYALARPRKGYLWPALRAAEARHPEAVALLRDLLGQTDILRPYELIERILTRHLGRQKLIGRLGPEVEDGIDALLAQALAYEASDVPSLTGFLEWAQADDLKIKRPADAGGDMLRVMTVHGAKGLEAPVVILPDCAIRRAPAPGILAADASGVIWGSKAGEAPARHSAARAAAREADDQERDRLLYVAMTRAEKWLIVAAAGETGEGDASWYAQAETGLRAAGAVPTVFDFEDGGGAGLSLESHDWAGLVAEAVAVPGPETPEPAPAFATRPAPPPPPRTAARTPSDLGGAKALPGDEGDDSETAMARGTLIHGLLEQLAPLAPDRRPLAGQRYLDAALRDPDLALAADLAPEILSEALAVLTAPALAPLFAPGSMAEVPISAALPGIGRIHGIIDRLIVTGTTVLAVDFKSNRVLPDHPDTVPEAILRQMGAYAAALGQIYPDRDIATALVWTAGATRMDLPHATVMAALRRAAAT
jgi:ATP-dependent helicase/nuclease subunit A